MAGLCCPRRERQRGKAGGSRKKKGRKGEGGLKRRRGMEDGRDGWMQRKNEGRIDGWRGGWIYKGRGEGKGKMDGC